MLNKSLYIQEMTQMIDIAISKIQSEKTNFKIYTVSIWTDPESAISSINFDSLKNSLKNVKKSNKWSNKYYEQYKAEGDLEQAELFRPIEGSRICNPADFELRDFDKITNKSFGMNWESDTDGQCWEELEPALIEMGNAAFEKVKKLNVEFGFELAVNSKRDWYDTTWG